MFGLNNSYHGRIGLPRPKDAIVTRVLTITYQTLTCEHPPEAMRASLYGKQITVAANHTLMKSTALYTPVKPPQKKKKTYCACLLMWYRAEFLLEWIWYHHAVHGLEKIFIYDNDSTLDNLKKEVERLQEHFDIEYIPWHIHKIQPAYHGHCALRAQHECEWASFTDVDEFIYVEKNERLSDYLKVQRPNVGGLELRMITMSSGDVHKVYKPEGGTVRGYTCSGKSTNWKSIVRPDALHQSLVNAVHYYGYQYPPFTGKRMYGSSGNTDTGYVRLYHYKNQAWEIFMRKYIRRASPATKRFKLKSSGGSNIPRAHLPDATWTKLMDTECVNRNKTMVYDTAQCHMAPKRCPHVKDDNLLPALILGIGGLGSGLQWMQKTMDKHGIEVAVADWGKVRDGFSSHAKKDQQRYRRIIHHVRHPLAAIAASIALDADPTDEQYLETNVVPALRKWVIENQMLELVTDSRYRVEDVDLRTFCKQVSKGDANFQKCTLLPAFKPRIGFGPQGKPKSSISWETLYEADEYTTKIASKLAAQYGYTADKREEAKAELSDDDPKWRDHITA